MQYAWIFGFTNWIKICKKYILHMNTHKSGKGLKISPLPQSFFIIAKPIFEINANFAYISLDFQTK